MNNNTNKRIGHTAIATAAAAALAIAFAGTSFAQSQNDRTDRADRDARGTQAGSMQQDEGRTAGDTMEKKAAELKFPAGIEKRGDADLDAIADLFADLFAEALNAAVGDETFDDFVERLVDQDRNRFGEWQDDHDLDKLNEAAERFAEIYEEKYGEEFKIEEELFTGLTAIQGEVTNPQQVAGNWPVSAEQMGTNARLAGSTDRMDDDDDHMDDHDDDDRHEMDDDDMDDEMEDRIEDANLEEGREVALVSVPALKDMPALTVSLVNEFPGTWKIDIPNKTDYTKVTEKLTKHLEKLASDPASWPAEPMETRKLIAHGVLACVYGVESKSADAEKQEMQRSGMN